MRKKSEFIINKKYPEDWDKKSEQEKRKKEQEFGVASFFLYNYPQIKDFLESADNLCVEFNEGPDFFVYSNEDSLEKLGLEITDCYVDRRRNNLSICSDLEKICRGVIKDIQKKEPSKLYQKINYISVTFRHEVMACDLYDKKKLESELKDFIIDRNKLNGEYVCQVDIGYSVVYPEDENAPKVFLNSNMAYIVPHISDIAQIQKEAGLEADPVQRSIKDKEKKLVEYKQQCKYTVHKWWLCINVPESAYMNPISYHLPDNFKSKYDKIFLVTRSFYGCGVYLIYESINLF